MQKRFQLPAIALTPTAHLLSIKLLLLLLLLLKRVDWLLLWLASHGANVAQPTERVGRRLLLRGLLLLHAKPSTELLLLVVLLRHHAHTAHTAHTTLLAHVLLLVRETALLHAHRVLVLLLVVRKATKLLVLHVLLHVGIVHELLLRWLLAEPVLLRGHAAHHRWDGPSTHAVLLHHHQLTVVLLLLLGVTHHGAAHADLVVSAAAAAVQGQDRVRRSLGLGWHRGSSAGEAKLLLLLLIRHSRSWLSAHKAHEIVLHRGNSINNRHYPIDTNRSISILRFRGVHQMQVEESAYQKLRTAAAVAGVEDCCQ